MQEINLNTMHPFRFLNMATFVSPLPVEEEVHAVCSMSSSDLPQSSEDTKDALLAMLSHEQTRYRTPMGYSLGRSSTNRVDQVTEAWRRKICEWIFEVVDHFSFDRDVVWIALQYLDRSASAINARNDISRQEFQLLATTSLYLAIKLHGESDAAQQGGRLKLRISAFEELSRGLFTAATIAATEQRIMSLLDWHLNPPTPLYFVAHFMRLLPKWPSPIGTMRYREFAAEIYDVAKYLTELACFNVTLSVHTDPSMVAYGSLVCALEVVAAQALCSKDLQHSFLLNIAGLNPSWTPSDGKAMEVQNILRTISPETFEQVATPYLFHVISFTDSCDSVVEDARKESNRASPDCVCDDIASSDSQSRKRPRIAPDHS